MARSGHRALLIASGLVLAAGAVVWAGAGPAIGEDGRVSRLRAEIAATGSDTDLRDLLDQLREIDSTSSRRALEDVARSRHRMAAVLAAHTIARAGYDGAWGALRRIAADATRDRAVRTAASQGLYRLAMRDGLSAEAADSAFDEVAGGDAALRASVRVSRAAYYPAPAAAITEGK